MDEHVTPGRACAWTAAQIMREPVPEKIHGQPYESVRLIADYARKHGRTTPATLARELVLDSETVRKYLRAAVKAGWVTIEPGVKRTNRWAVAL